MDFPIKRLPISFSEFLIAILASSSCYFLGMSLLRSFFGEFHIFLWALFIFVLLALTVYRVISSHLFLTQISPLIVPFVFLIGYKFILYFAYGLPEMGNPLYFLSLSVSFLFLIFGIAQGRAWRWAVFGIALYGVVLFFIGWWNFYVGNLSLVSSNFQFIVPLLRQGDELAGSYQHEGRFLTLSCISFFVISIYAKNAGLRTVSFLLTFSFVPLIFAVGARSSFVALITATGIIFVLHYRLPKFLLAVTASGISIIVLIVLFPDIGLQIGLGEYLIFNRLVLVSDVANDPSGRIGLWTSAVALWLSSAGTFLFGLGPNGYQRAAGLSANDYPHNFLLEIAVDYGVLGLMLWLFILIRLLRPAFRVTRSRSMFHAMIFGQLVVVFIHFLFQGGLHTTWPLFYLLATIWMANRSLDLHSVSRSRLFPRPSYFATEISASVQRHNGAHK